MKILGAVLVVAGDVFLFGILSFSTTTPALVLADLVIPGLPLLEFLSGLWEPCGIHDGRNFCVRISDYQR